jgi:hypothetical protein
MDDNLFTPLTKEGKTQLIYEIQRIARESSPEAALSVLEDSFELIEFLDKHFKGLPIQYHSAIIALIERVREMVADDYEALIQETQSLSHQAIETAKEYKETLHEQYAELQEIVIMLQRRIIDDERRRDRANRRGRRPGKRVLPVNVWAREQHAAGKSIDDLLLEYAEKRSMRDLVKARELLRKAIT